MERFGLGDARHWSGSARSWLSGWEFLAWHVRVAAVASAGLVLVNVAFAPANLWSLWVMAVWSALLALHAGAVVAAGRAADVAARASVPVAAVGSAPARAGTAAAPPLFSDRSPSVERPRPATGHVAQRGLDRPAVDRAAAVSTAIAAATRPVAPPAAAEVVPTAPPATADAGKSDVAVAVTVLPPLGDRSTPTPASARIAPASAPGTALNPADPRPVLPERVVALWGGAGASSAPADGWGHPAFAPRPWAPEATAASAD